VICLRPVELTQNVLLEIMPSHVHVQQDSQEVQMLNVYAFRLLVRQTLTVLLENLALTQCACLFVVPIKSVLKMNNVSMEIVC
jgi:hypothetical protein